MISLHRDTENLGDETRYYKNFEPVDLKDDIATIARLIATYVWSPNQWLDGGRRRQSSWTRAQYCVLDFDDGAVTLDQAKRMFADCWHILGTTRSHQRPKGSMPACDRFRAVLRFERPIEDLAEFRTSQAFWVRRFGSDEACVDGARFYWPCLSIVSTQPEGDSLEVIAPLPRPQRDYTLTRKVKMIPRYLHPVLMKGPQEGERNSVCFRLGAELTRCGFDADRVLQIVESAPISLSLEEIRRAVSNGIKAAVAEGIAHD